MRSRRASFAAVLVAMLAGTTSARAYCRLTTEMPDTSQPCATGGKPLFWKRQCLGYSVVPREVEEPTLDEIRDVVDNSFGAWDQITCDGDRVGLDLQQTIGTIECIDAQYNPSGPNANAVIFVSDWAERKLPSEAFGLTMVWHHAETGEIFDADLQINEGLGDLTICSGVPPECGSGEVDIQNVVTHEAGHYLGLGHTEDDPLATMAARAFLGETSKRSLAEDDRDGLCAIYGENPASACAPEDFQPDNGFASSCYFPEPDGLACGACSTPGAAPAVRANPPAFASRMSLVVVLAALIAGYRWRRRVTASTSSPKPSSK